MILTSNFKIAGHLPQAVAISLGVPRGWRGARCSVLAPPRPLFILSQVLQSLLGLGAFHQVGHSQVNFAGRLDQVLAELKL
jgi:hypothetical protein